MFVFLISFEKINSVGNNFLAVCLSKTRLRHINLGQIRIFIMISETSDHQFGRNYFANHLDEILDFCNFCLVCSAASNFCSAEKS